MGYIGSLPSDLNSGAKPRNDFTGDGTTTAFTLSQSVPGGFESNVLVIVDNVIQQPLEAYTITGANYTTLQFSEAPAAGAVVYVLHQGNATQFVAPSTGSVDASALADNLRNFTVDTFTGNGSTTAFTLTETPISANSILVIVDGILQTRTTNYTLATNVVTFTGAPDNGSAITVIHLGFSTISRTGVVDGSITPVKLSSGAPIWDISGNVTYTGGLTGGTGVINIGSGQFYKAAGGNIGVNTITPNTKMYIAAAGVDGFSLGIDTADNTASTRLFGQNNTGIGSIYYGANGWSFNTGAVLGSTSGVPRLVVNPNGVVSLTGATQTATGTGIAFPASQNASSDPNTLDDYEEGTFTPTQGAQLSGTITTVNGIYTKIGKIVTVQIWIGGSSLATSAGGLLLSGLPFTVATTGNTLGVGGFADESNANYRGMFFYGTSIYSVGASTSGATGLYFAGTYIATN